MFLNSFMTVKSSSAKTSIKAMACMLRPIYNPLFLSFSANKAFLLNNVIHYYQVSIISSQKPNPLIEWAPKHASIWSLHVIHNYQVISNVITLVEDFIGIRVILVYVLSEVLFCSSVFLFCRCTWPPVPMSWYGRPFLWCPSRHQRATDGNQC